MDTNTQHIKQSRSFNSQLPTFSQNILNPSKLRLNKFSLLFIFTLISTFNFHLSIFSQTNSPFPTDHLQLWLRADSIELTDGKISNWYNLSSTTYEIVQTDETARPTINEDAINGHPALLFDGTSSFLNGGNILNIGTKGWTYLIVAKINDPDAKNRFLSKGDRNNGWGNTSSYNWFIGNSSLIYMNGNRYDIGNEGQAGIYAIYGYELFDRNCLENKSFLNGIKKQSVPVNNINAINSCEFNIGRSHPSNSGYYMFSGEIAEIIILDTIDNCLRNTIYNYIAERYFPDFLEPSVSLGLDIHVPYGFCDTAITTAYNPDFTSYLWSTGETDSVIHVNRSGRYTVTVTNSFGVTSTDDINVYFPEILQMQDTTICAGNTISWEIGLASREYSFQWHKNGEIYAGNNNSLTLFEEGLYNCIITDSLGCTFQTYTLNFKVDNYPNTASFRDTYRWPSISTDTSLCSGNTIGLATNINETTSYLWNTGSTSPRITIIQSGEYSLTTTNTRGCFAENTINVTILGEAPEINYSIDNLCFKDSTYFVGNAYSEQSIESYLWIVDDTDSIMEQSFNLRFSTIGNHNIRTIVTSNNTCRSDSSFTINIKELPEPNFTYTPICSGIPMNFIGNSHIPTGTVVESYTWIINDSIIGTNENLTFRTDDAGIVPITYTISISNGCQADTTINISVRDEYAEPRFVSPAYPSDGMLVYYDSIQFLWNYDYDILYYNLITSQYSDFANADTIACTTNSITLPSGTFADTTYWKVAAYNHCLVPFESEPCIFRKTAIGNNIVTNNPNLQLWLRADSTELTDGKISNWYNLSSTAYEIVQTDETARPTINENAINGHPALLFDGISSFLNGGNILNIGTKGWTYLIVAKINDTDAKNRFLSKGDRNNGWGNTSSYNWFIGNSSLIYMNGNRYDIENEGQAGIYAIYGYELYDRNCLENKSFLNGIKKQSVSVNNINAINSCEFNIGRSHPSNSGYYMFSGEIAEIIILDTIDNGLRNTIYNYIAERYFPGFLEPSVSLGLDIHVPYGFCDSAITNAYNPNFTSYIWSTGETDSVIHVNRSGRYTVTVTNSFGVTSTDDINVYFPEHFQLQDTTICEGDTIYWNIKMRQDEYSFQWFKDSTQLDNTSNQIEISEAGAYTCLITDTLGCSFQTDPLHLTIDKYPVSAGFENSDTTLCYGNRLHLSSNYEETASAIWNDGTSDLEHYLTQPGTYTVTTTNTRGCTATNSINVNIQGRVPTPNFTTEGHCQYAEVTTTNLSTSEVGEISLYRWFANDSLIGTSENISHSFDEYGTQSLKLYLETSDHCFNDTTIPIYIYPQPKPDFSPKHFCQNAPTEISARTTIAEGDIINHLWNLGDGDITGESVTNTFESYGIKTITLSAESEQGCIGTKDIEVNVLQAEMPATEISGVCLGYETTFINKTPFNNINPQTAWEWNFGVDTETSSNKNTTHTYDTTGTYNVSLTVSFANHCTTTTDTTITIHELPEAIITTNDGCVGTETTLDAEIISVDNIYTYKWQIDSIFESSEQRPTFVSDTTGKFAVTLDVLTEFSCPAQATDSIIIHGKPDVAFTQSRDWGGSPLYVDFENKSEGATSYHWDFGNEGESTQPNPYFIFTAPGTYNVTLAGTSPDGCTSRYTSAAITVVEPIVDIMLMNLKAEVENSFARISLVVVNLGTLPVEDLVLELRFNDRTLRESIDYIAQGEVRPYTFGTQMPIPQSNDIKSTICVEALVPDVEGHSDMNLANNSLCITDAENLSVGIPYPIPAREQITCDIYTKIPTDLYISIFNIFGKLVKHEQISQHKGYLKYVVNVMDLAGGMYFIRVNSKDESITHKFEIR